MFALGALHPQDVLPLWLLCATLVGIGLVLMGRSGGWRIKLAALLVPFLGMVGVELLIRLYLKTTDEPRERMVELADRTHEDQTVYAPHPFLQFTGRPGLVRADEGEIPRGGGFNERGFPGPELPSKKQPGALRIACLGGSTTASGYPFVLEQDLQGLSDTVEVLSFGVTRYSSTHSTVNFVLNVVDFEPDYVVFHHAWNDHWARDRDATVRGDASHFMREFRYPEIPDARLIRASVIYRYFKDRVQPAPPWTFLTHALMAKTPLKEGAPYRDLSELAPYERNVRTIVDLALLRGIVPVLTTQPHATDPNVPRFRSPSTSTSATTSFAPWPRSMENGWCSSTSIVRSPDDTRSTSSTSAT